MHPSEKVERIIHEVAALSVRERDELMCELDTTHQDEMITDWREEIHRRASEIDDGQVPLVDEEKFLHQLRAV